MMDEYKKAAQFKRNNSLKEALVHFQRVSVFGFFVFDSNNLQLVSRALAATYRDMNNKKLALHWAQNAKKFKDSKDVDNLIASINKL